MTAGDRMDALTAAAIPRERWGAQRLSALTDGERDFYRWILRSFRAGAPPSLAELADSASHFELEVEPTLERLRRQDLVHHDPGTGAILVAYPFSGRPTAHRVHFESGESVFAMCAIDALGMAPMLGERIQVASRDPLTGEEIRIELAADGEGDWQPQEAVVVCGTSGCGKSSSSCCPVLNFFASTASAERWLAARTDVQGEVTSMPDAIAAGRTVFGDVLRRDRP
jgi:hypothetical protein